MNEHRTGQLLLYLRFARSSLSRLQAACRVSTLLPLHISLCYDCLGGWSRMAIFGRKRRKGGNHGFPKHVLSYHKSWNMSLPFLDEVMPFGAVDKHYPSW